MSLALCGKVLALQANNKHTTIEVGSVGEWNLNYNGKVKILMEVEGPIEKNKGKMLFVAQRGGRKP